MYVIPSSGRPRGGPSHCGRIHLERRVHAAVGGGCAAGWTARSHAISSGVPRKLPMTPPLKETKTQAPNWWSQTFGDLDLR